MCRVPDQVVRQNGILIRICELPGPRLLPVKMRHSIDIAKVEQQDADMFGRAKKSCLTEIKVSLICAISLHVRTAKFDNLSHLVAAIPAFRVIIAAWSNDWVRRYI